MAAEAPLWACLLLILGIILFAAEGLMPGFGSLSAGALVAMAVAAFIMANGKIAFFLIFFSAFGVSILLLVALRVLCRRFGVFDKITLHEQAASPETVSRNTTSHESARCVMHKGDTGVSLTALRISGTARIDGKKCQVFSKSGYIEAGAEIRVYSIDGERIEVERV